MEEKEKLTFSQYGYTEGLKTIADLLHFKGRRHFIWGFASGIWIGFVYTCAIFASAGITTPCIRSLVLGSIFPVVIWLIFFIGGQFFTAYTAIIPLVYRKIVPVKEACRGMWWCYLGNVIGILAFTIIFRLSCGLTSSISYNTLNQTGEWVFDMGISKLYDVGFMINSHNAQNLWSHLNGMMILKTLAISFGSGILCNSLVSLTIIAGKSTKGNVGAMMVLWFTVIFNFVVLGYQHCVANWLIVWYIFLNGIFKDNSLAHGYTIGLNISIMLILFNIVPCFFGNIVGAIGIGEMLYWCNIEVSKKFFIEIKEKYNSVK